MSFTPGLIKIAEPELQFAFGQAMAHPKDGLPLYGPLREPLTGGRLRIGVVGLLGSLTPEESPAP
jgi:hypothetical protein